MNHRSEQPRVGRFGQAVPLMVDAVMGAASFVVAMYLRLAEKAWQYPVDYVECSFGFAAILVACLFYERSNRRLWRYVSMSDLMAIARAAFIAVLLFYMALFIFMRLENFPRSVVPIHFMTLMVFLVAPRVLWRLKHDRTLMEKLRGQGKIRTPVLLVGAGRKAELFIRESVSNPNFPYRVVALVDDDIRNHGREIHHVRIYGTVEETGYIIGKLEKKNRKPQRIVLSEDLPEEPMVALLRVAEAARVSLARMPSLTELSSGAKQGFEVQAIAVEDILGRAEKQLDIEAMRNLISGKRVMITGAGGSIGSELTQQIAGFGPAALVLYELSEFNLYSIDHRIGEMFAAVKHVPVVGDVRDAAQLKAVMEKYKPEIVFHAAALKHVPMCETNADQAIFTNVQGSRQVADACVAAGVALMVQISTDKAVNPLSVMGASKRVAEIYCQALGASGASTKFVTVRFGNVLGSAGSVVPLFQRQIAKGGPVTITHPDMTRYFMTITEAVELVLQAAALDGDAQPHIYVLEMGKPVRIEEMARQMIRLAGLRPGEDIEIKYTGLRLGEKLYEELFHEGERLENTTHPSIRHAKARAAAMARIDADIAALVEAAKSRDVGRIKAALKNIVPEFTPEERVAA